MNTPQMNATKWLDVCVHARLLDPNPIICCNNCCCMPVKPPQCARRKCHSYCMCEWTMGCGTNIVEQTKMISQSRREDIQQTWREMLQKWSHVCHVAECSHWLTSLIFHEPAVLFAKWVSGGAEQLGCIAIIDNQTSEWTSEKEQLDV